MEWLLELRGPGEGGWFLKWVFFDEVLFGVSYKING
jgi:hypothetical protein